MDCQCEICEQQAVQERAGSGGHKIRCPRCGIYRITGEASGRIRCLPREQKIKLSAWTYEQGQLGELPLLTYEVVEGIFNIREPRLGERAEKLLLWLVRNQGELGRVVDARNLSAIAASWSDGINDIVFILGLLEANGWVKKHPALGHAAVAPAGVIYTEEIGTRRSSSSQGFVAMWFADDMSRPYTEGFAQGIRAAGYDPVRIDGVEHVGKIDDEIIAQIRRSRFIVADFTGHRGGVYFEAGFALGFGLPVVWTCRKDDLSDLHFDIRQFNTIVWNDPFDLSRKLKNRIEAVIGVGPLPQVALGQAEN